jgi:hypothetical protein
VSARRSSKRFRYVLGGLVVAIATGGAIGAAMGATGGPADPRTAGGRHTGHPVTYASVTQGPAKTPQSSNHAAGRVLRGLGGTNVRGLEARPSRAGLVVTVALAQNNDDVTNIWLAGLAVGALGERMRTNQAVINDEIASATAVGPGSNGAQVTSNLGLGAVSLGQVFDSPSDAVLRSHVNAIAHRFGLKVSRLSILHPLESALRVTFVVPESGAIDWTIDQLRVALVGASPDVEGILIELDNAAGQPLLLSGVAYRTGEGGLWFAPGQDARFGALHGGPPVG